MMGSSKGRLRFARILGMALFLVSLSQCTWMSEDQASLFNGGPVLKRAEAKARLQAAVFVNFSTCPENMNAAYYAMDFVIPSFLNDAFYTAESVEFCQVALLLTPCGLSPDNDLSVLTNLYRSILATCQLKVGTL